MAHPLFTQTTVARTANGALTNATSGSKVLDFFSIVGASRGKDITAVFKAALNEDRNLALRALLWARDIRGGAGERDTFRKLFATLSLQDQVALSLLVPQVGRWDDLLDLAMRDTNTALLVAVAATTEAGLAAKWVPRQGRVASTLRHTVGMSAKEWRKTVVANSNTVEQKMSARNWAEINYAHVPSCASNLYRKAFNRNDSARYQEYLSAVEKGKAKINAGAIFPHTLVEAVMKGDSRTPELQWKALPDYIGDSPARFLPVVDVSGSMQSAGVLQHAVALGIYLAERNKSVFKDHIVSFSGDPHFHDISASTLADKVRKVCRSGEDMSTNIQGVFDVLLSRAKQLKLSQNEMPTHLLILSDMEFNSAGGWYKYGDYGYRFEKGGDRTNYQAIVQKFKAAGYELPTLVFWNLYARAGNSPVTTDDYGTMLVSGFSPTIMKNVLNCKTVTPYDLMVETLCVPRYDFE